MTVAATFGARVAELLGPGRLQAGVPLAPLTTFQIGGPAEWLLDVRTEDELAGVVRLAADCGVPVAILGGGSNVLVSDDGVAGAVIRPRLRAISHDGSLVRAESGVSINGLVRWTIGHGLSGLQAWAGTPGTVGGAIAGNAHWGGRNIGDLVRRVRVIAADGAGAELEGADMEFGYDTSRLQRTHELLVWAEFSVGTGPVTALREEARASLHYRKRTQPLALPSAGCVFQNPVVDVDPVPEGIPPSAGALVDRAGLKGHRVGGARISTTHANFIVNEAGATARDVRDLIEIARRTVAERFGVELRDEVVYLGKFRDG